MRRPLHRPTRKGNAPRRREEARKEGREACTLVGHTRAPRASQRATATRSSPRAAHMTPPEPPSGLISPRARHAPRATPPSTPAAAGEAARPNRQTSARLCPLLTATQTPHHPLPPFRARSRAWSAGSPARALPEALFLDDEGRADGQRARGGQEGAHRAVGRRQPLAARGRGRGGQGRRRRHGGCRGPARCSERD